jgi:hypothetical protein
MDTGATTSILGKRFSNHSSGICCAIGRQFSNDEIKLYKSNEETLVCVGKHCQLYDFMISPDSNYALVVGMDWINKNVRAIDFSKWQIVLESEEWGTTEIIMSGDTVLSEYFDFFNGENNLPSNSVYACKLLVKDTKRQFKNQSIQKLSVDEQKKLHKQIEEALKKGTIIHSTAEITFSGTVC